MLKYTYFDASSVMTFLTHLSIIFYIVELKYILKWFFVKVHLFWWVD